MQSNFTFDVMILSPKTGWTSVSRWESADQARQEANKLVSSDKHEGVKITQEHFDYERDQFLEKTVFLRTRSGSKMPGEAPPDEETFVPVTGLPAPVRNRQVLTWIAGISGAFVFLIVLGVVFVGFGDHGFRPDRDNADLIHYELPTVRTNVALGDEVYSVQMTLQMELYHAEDSRDVEANLAPIMEVIIEQLRHTSASDLNNSAKLQKLRAAMTRKVAEIMGSTRFEGILFKDIQLRLL